MKTFGGNIPRPIRSVDERRKKYVTISRTEKKKTKKKNRKAAKTARKSRKNS